MPSYEYHYLLTKALSYLLWLLTLNADKCHLIVSGYKYEAMYAKVGDALLWEEHSVKLSRLFIDSNLSFHDHVKELCKKASQKASLANVIC